MRGGRSDEGMMRGGLRSKPRHSSLYSYLGKEGFALPGWDGKMEGGETSRTGRPLRGGGGSGDAEAAVVHRAGWGTGDEGIKIKREMK